MMVWWNNTYPLDRWYRQKHKIAFNSPEHRRVNPIDIYREWLEDHLFEDYRDRIEAEEKAAQLLRQGIWISKPQLTQKQRDDLWSKIDVSKINQMSNAIKVVE